MIKAFGSFRKVGKHIFRTEARIQWGDSEEQFGMIIMLNPGASKLLDSAKWAYLESQLDGEATGELVFDDTMKLLVKILESSFGDLEGSLVIKNLFNLREPKSKIATGIYKNLISDQIFSEVIYDKFDDLEKYPWIWLGWGVEDKAILNKRKREVKDKIPLGKLQFGVYPEKNSLDKIHIYHPYPKLKSHREQYLKSIVNQFIVASEQRVF